jgi:hypothetical protein
MAHQKNQGVTAQAVTPYLLTAVKDACKVPSQSAPEYVPLIWSPAAFTIAKPLKNPAQNGPCVLVNEASSPDTVPEICPTPPTGVENVPDTEESD